MVSMEDEYLDHVHDAEQLLNAVDHVLDTIDAGTFGQCRSCGEPIDAERLASDPLVDSCERHLALGLSS